MIPPVTGLGAHQPPGIAIPSRCPHLFRVVPLGRPTRWFRRIGYTEAILSGDPDFDGRWSVESDDGEFARALVQRPEVRAAIARLGKLGSRALAHSRRRLVAVVATRVRGRDARRERDQAVREQLAAIDRAIAKLLQSRLFPNNGGRLRLAIIAVLLALVLIAGLVGMAFGGNELIPGELGRLALWSLLFSAPLTLAFCGAMARLLAGRSASHRDLGVVVLLAVFALPAAGIGASALINAWADEGPPAARRLAVIQLVRERRDDGKRYESFAIVPAWRSDRGPTQRIRLSGTQAGHVVPGRSELAITTSPGRLGFERLLECRLEDGPAAR